MFKADVSIKKDFTYKRLILVIGVMEDKDISNILQRVIPYADYLIFTKPEYYRSVNPEFMMNKAPSMEKPNEIVPVMSDAIERAKEIAGHKDLILITGSLFTVGEALSYLDPDKYRPDEI